MNADVRDIHGWFERQAARAPDAVALVLDARQLTYGELDRRANLIACRLRLRGIGPGACVGLLLDRSLELIAAVLGVLKAGAAYLPLDPAYPSARRTYMLADSGAEAVISHRQLLRRLPGPVGEASHESFAPGTVVIDLDAEGAAISRLARGRPVRATPGSLAYVIYTSGSTGRPKGVQVTHDSVISLLRSIARQPGLGPRDVLLAVTTLSFDISVVDVFLPLVRGARVVLASRETAVDGPRLRDLLVTSAASFMQATPASWRMLIESGWRGNESLLILCTGEQMPRQLATQLLERGASVWNLYGPTETTVWATAHRVSGDRAPRPVPIGRAIAGAEILLFDDRGRPVESGASGEVYIGGTGLSPGYLQRPAMTAEVFVPHSLSPVPGSRLYRAGDLARREPGGNLEFLGRADHQIKIRGHRIELGEVEAGLLRQREVAQAVVAVHEGASGDRRLVAYVKPRERDLEAAERVEPGDRVAHWHAVWGDLYRRPGAAPTDADFDTAGWISSYDGRPIPVTEMREWVDLTVEKILALRPDRVLEIGCGTGLLLQRIAPHCTDFVGCDVSRAVLDTLSRRLSRGGDGLPQVQLKQRAAADFEGFARGRFDTVILNSVVQYFPSVGYLTAVLEGAAAATAHGGSIFVGDVRCLPLQEAFRASLEVRQSAGSLPVAELRERVCQRLLREEELLLDPAFFRALGRLLPRLGHVRIQPKAGRSRNELTRFRYDVILHLDVSTPELVDAEHRRRAGRALRQDEVREFLTGADGVPSALVGVPDPRLTAEIRLLELLRTAADSVTVAELQRGPRKACLEVPAGIEPDDLRSLGEGLGYCVELSWGSRHQSGCYDAIFWRPETAERPPTIGTEVQPPADRADQANQPLRHMARRRLARRWRQALEGELPTYMIPAAFVLLDALPLTPGGKLDRQALPNPSGLGIATEEPFVSPQGPHEEALAEIFTEVLGVARVGAHDDFVTLGGHSLMATRLSSRVRRAYGVELSMRTVLEYPTVARLARWLTESRRRTVGETTPLQRVSRRGDLPLSFGQERLWLSYRLEPSSRAYVLPLTLRLRGRLDAAALERALGEIVRRHEVLRTLIRNAEGGGVQVIQPAAFKRLPRIDLQRLDGRRRREAQRIAAVDARRPFDLEAEPPLRTVLLRLGRAEHVLLLTFHHIASDGWSDTVFFRELGTLYGAFRGGRGSPLAALPLQVVDYAAWQREWLTGETLEGLLVYWRQQLRRPLERLELSTDRTRPPVRTDTGARRRFVIPGQLRLALESLGQAHGATLFMVLLAGFQTLLQRLTSQSRIAVGTPVANRGHPQIEGLIGFFVNTLVLRVELGDDPTVAEVLSRVRHMTLGAHAHQDLPFDKLVRELEPVRDPGCTPLFQAMLVMEDSPAKTLRLDGLDCGLETRDNGASMFDLTLYLDTAEVGLGAVIEYTTDLFDATTIDRLGGHFRTLLEGLVAAPDDSISSLPMLSAAERQALLVEAADTAEVSVDESLCQIFQRQVAAIPDAMALVGGREHLTYRRLDQEANRLARHLRRLGVESETVVGVCLERAPRMVLAVLAVLKAGATYLPLDPSYPRRRLALMLHDARALVLISRWSLVADLLVDAPRLRLVDVEADRSIIARRSTAALDEPEDPERAAYVIYTSGSRGAPKGVVGLDRGVVNRCRWMWRRAPFAAGEVCCQKTSLSFVDSVWEIFGPLLAGVPSVLVPEDVAPDPHRLVTLLGARRVSRMVLVPSLLRLLLETFEDIAGRLPDLRWWVVSGEALLPDLARRFAVSMPRAELFNLYGSSEVAADVTCFDATGFDTRQWASLSSVPIGRPIANTEIQLVDRRLRPLVTGVAGELAAGGAGLARGYLRRPRLSAGKFVPDPWSGSPGARLYLTGDRGRRLTGGEIDFLGRFDDQVKIRGFRIELGEIAVGLRAHPMVRQAVTVARDAASGDQRLVAYIVPHVAGTTVPDAAALRGFLAARLPDFMVPSLFIAIDELPLLANGKIDRAALPETCSGMGLNRRFVPARTPIEEILAAIWSEVLDVPRVGIHDNFFALGGHSLLATRVTSRLRQSLGRSVAPGRLFQHPTVARLGADLGRSRGDTPRLPELRAVDRHGASPTLSFAQERMWFLEQLTTSGAAYNLPEAWQLTGDLDRKALSRAWGEIVRRHEILRSVVHGIDGRPVQTIVADRRRELPVVDLAGLKGSRQALARCLAVEEARRPFDLEHGPLARALLLHLGGNGAARDQGAGDRHVLLLTLHHSVSDGWSRTVLRRELGALYQAFHQRRPSPLPELEIQYADFAGWQRRALQGEILNDQLEYWRRQLSDLEPLELPADRPRPAYRSGAGAGCPLAVDEPVTTALKQLGVRHGASLYMTLLAAFLVLLHRLTGQRDLAVGSLVANRGRRQLERLIGLFVNSLVLRVNLSGGLTFSELLSRVREVALAAYAHQDLPFEKLVAELAPGRDLSRNPLFQVVLTLHETPVDVELTGLSSRPIEVETVSTRFDLAVHLWEIPAGGLAGLVSYDTDLFDATRIARLTRSFEGVLEALGNDSEQRVSSISSAVSYQAHQATIEWNDRQDSMPWSGSVAGLFAARAAAHPEATALSWGDSELSYGELERWSRRVASLLVHRGVGPENVVGLHLDRGPELVVAILAVWQAGGAYLPLEPSHPVERLSYMIEDADVYFLLTREPAAFPKFSPARTWSLAPGWRARLPEAGAPSPWPKVAPEHPAYVLYTSGSTGRPKGVLVPHQGLANRVLWGQEAYPLTDGDAVLQLAAPSFDFSVWEILATLSTGARLVLAPREAADLEGLTRRISHQRVTVAHFAPSLLEAWLETEGAGKCTSLRRVFCGGEVLRSDLYRRFSQCLDAEMDNQYGPTEASIDVTYQRARALGDWPDRPTVAMGRPIANTEIHLLDARLRALPIGATGEISIGGIGLARGYLRRPSLTAERFVPHALGAEPGARLYRSGDLARHLRGGVLEFVGRLDHQVKVRGVRLELGEIEHVLLEHPAVRSAVAILHTGQATASLVAYVVLRPGATLAVGELRRALGRRLPSHVMPSRIVPLDEVPRLPSGKVDRPALALSAQTEEVGNDAAFIPARTPIEELLAEVWREVLDVPKVGARDDFFTLGGHSLLATQVTSRIRRTLGLEVPVRVLFEQRTVAELAQSLEKAEAATVPPPMAAGHDRHLPLSFGQERLWFLDRLEESSTAYNVATAFELEGALDLGALAASFREVVRRHEALRTTFHTEGGSVRQVISAVPTSMIEVVDLRALDGWRCRAVADRLAREAAVRPFDLTRGPLLRVLLLRLSDRHRHLLLLTLHHIVSDAWSTGVLHRELCALYPSFAIAKPSSLPELEIQYADFAAWQRRWLRGAVLERQLDYWRGQLTTLPELKLPVDRPRPMPQTFRGASCALALSAASTMALKALGARSGASQFMTLLAAFMTLIGRFSGQRDFAVGSPIANRGIREIEDLIGFFVNTQVLRADLSSLEAGGEPTFLQVLQRVREMALDAYAHQDLPFEKLVEALAPERDLSRHPLFQILFTLNNASRPAVEIAGLTLRPLDIDNRRVRFDLEWHLQEQASYGLPSSGGTQLHGWVVFNTDLFDSTTAKRWGRHFESLLEAILERPEGHLDELSILGVAERHQLLGEWNGHGVPSVEAREEAVVLELFAAQVHRAPDAVALHFADVFLSYRELDQRAAALASQLRAHGVGPEVAVALQIERSPMLLIAALAVLVAGGAYVPVDPAWPRRRRDWILEDSRAEVLLVDRSSSDGSLARVPPDGDLQRIALDHRGLGMGLPSSSQEPPMVCSPEHPAYVIYTSGSTGRPKGVAMRRGALDHLIRWQIDSPRFAARLRTLQFASFGFDVSFQETFATWCSGGTLVLISEASRRDAREWVKIVARTAVERLFLPVVALDQLAEVTAGQSRPLPALKEVITAGEQLHVTALVRAFFQHSGQATRSGRPTLHNHYGPSETHVVTYLDLAEQPHQWAARPVVGAPIAGSRVYVLDFALRPAPIGIVGEIHVGGAALARGYWRRSARTAARFIPDPFAVSVGGRLYRTGDLGRHRGDGSIEFFGRADHQLKIRGFRVEPGEIEVALEGHPWVRHAVVRAVGKASPPSQQRLVAYLVPHEPGRLDVDALRPWLLDQVPEHMVPSAFMILDGLPVTPTGKVDRRALPEPAVLSPDAGASYVAPVGEAERQLAGIFAGVLGWPRVGVDDDFFALGGHSLLAVRLMSSIERRFGVELPLSAVFRHPTVRALAALLHQEQVPASSPLVTIKAGGEQPPLFLVHPGGGHVLCYRDLAGRLGGDRPLYGLEATHDLGTVGGIEAMAESYLDAVLESDPNGSYRLGGWSLGGLVAFEMARRARLKGLEVPFLALIDTASPGERPNEASGALLASFARDLGLPAADLGRPPVKTLDDLLDAASRAGQLGPGMGRARLRQLYELFWHRVAAAGRYAPRRFDGRVTYFAAGDRPAAEVAVTAGDWGGLAAAGIEVVTVPGDHFSMIREPDVLVLTHELEERLRRFDARQMLAGSLAEPKV